MNENWLIVGLGNPGDKYKTTRHNIGFMVTSHLAGLLGIKLKEKKDFKARLGVSKNIIIAQPLTFMNDSGVAVQKISSYYQIPNERIIIVYDDVYLVFSKLRAREKGSAGGHNGIKSIIQELSGENFPRIKIGIGPVSQEVELIDFVLGNFNEEEQKKLPEIIETCSRHLYELLNSPLQILINNINNSVNPLDKNL